MKAAVTAAALVCAIGAALGLVARGQTARPELDAKVDAVFGRWTTASPGCSVGVGVRGRPVLEKGYGMADLEHDIPNRADTIFEAGSVAKQFTAAAVLLLVADGKLSLDDPARKYIPELPDYGTPLTIRHMLTHTSGLRDWGSVAAIGGWPRTTRVHTHAHVLEIVGRQKFLNFLPGTRYSYSNTGYNLAAIIVSRVSGMSFADFTRTRIFAPLGMTRTSWRDDFTRIVKDRAIAYEEDPDGYKTLMPFENVHGNGGLLTTVGDLLKWNENFVSPKVGNPSQIARQQQRDRFNDHREHGYALGLMIGTYKSVREVSHSGSTAGYSAFLVRYPDQHVSVAVLCNVTTSATNFAHAVADLYLGNAVRPPASPRQTHTMSAQEVAGVVGVYRDTLTGTPVSLVADSKGVRLQQGSLLVPKSGSSLVTSTGQTWTFDGRGGAKATDEYGTVDTYERVDSVNPTPEQLAAFAGSYSSQEAEAQIDVQAEGSTLILKRRPDTKLRLTPLYANAFSSSMGTIIFHRDRYGRPVDFSVVQQRVWDLRFTKD
jgi:CubicO group peptidase (beta-lactamase class C family)